MKSADWLALVSVMLSAYVARRYHFAREDLLRFRQSSLNNTRDSLANVLVFNRVAKVGSQTLWLLLDRLAARNKFLSFADTAEAKAGRGHGENTFLPESKERWQYYEYLRNQSDSVPDIPFSYSKHVNYIDFTEFDPGFRPVYVNLVRDPVDRIVSWYYYTRAPWYRLEVDPETNRTVMNGDPTPVKDLKTKLNDCILEGRPECLFEPGQRVYMGTQGQSHCSQISFFCGHAEEDGCHEFGSRAALAKAMENVERRYAVVGVTEDFDKSLRVLEAYVPRFFRGASDFYRDQLGGLRRNSNLYKPRLSEEARVALAKNFTLEYEFYEFCKQRLEKQHELLNL